MKTKVLTYDGFITLVNNHELLNNNKIMAFINRSENVKKYHTHLCKHFNKALTKKSNQLSQSGGDPTTIAVIIGSIGFVLAVGYLIMKMTKPPSKCKSHYQILQEGQYPTTVDFLKKIVPRSWIGNTKNSEEAIYNLTHKINSLSDVLSVIDTDSSLIKSVGVNLLRVTSSIALDIATLGAGGDIIISLLFTFKSVIDLIGAIITHLNDIISDVEATRLLYDILNINFLGGPFHVKCWIKYILNEYGSDTPAYQTVCNFFHKIFDKLANFMGIALGAMIPDSIGIPGILIPELIKKFKSGAVNTIEAQINKYYKKIPRDIKIMLNKPRIFKKFLDRKIKRGQKYLMSIGDNIAEKLLDNTWAFAYAIHKFFALMFSLFFILKLCLKEQ
jgi:hypothetical protein